MQVHISIEALRGRLRELRHAGRTVGFVPTMGYLHAGHMALVAKAKAENDSVVVSIFVNPLQFGPSEDLARYPRDLERDTSMLGRTGVDFVFAPAVDDMYPHPIQTIVDVPDLGRELEGAVRPGHFAGVATVVCKLLNIVQPDAAYFGEKDYQQVVIVKRMVEDLAMPVRIVPVVTERDVDGLALSSRNRYLGKGERRAAAVVPETLKQAERLIADGIRDPNVLEAALKDFLKREPLAVAEVVAVRDAVSLRPVKTIRAPVVVALFVRFGSTRLLDSRVIDVKTAAREETVR